VDELKLLEGKFYLFIPQPLNVYTKDTNRFIVIYKSILFFFRFPKKKFGGDSSLFFPLSLFRSKKHYFFVSITLIFQPTNLIFVLFSL